MPPPRLLVAVSIAVALLFAIAYAAALRESPPIQGDFLQDWASARAVLEGDDPYGSLDEAARRYTGTAYDELPVNAHPPASILVALPFGAVAYPVAVRLWNGVGLLALVCALVAIIRELGVHPAWLAPAAAVLLASRAFEMEFSQGQWNTLLLAGLVAAWGLARRGRAAASGGLLGALAAIKVLPWVFALGFAAARSHRGVAGFGVGFAGLCGLAAAVLGPEVFVGFLGAASGVEAYHGHVRNASLLALAVKLGAPVAVAAAGPLLVLGATAWRARRLEVDRAFAAWSLAMLIAAPLLWQHYLLLAVLPWAILMREAEPPARLAMVGGGVTIALVRPAWLAGVGGPVLAAALPLGILGALWWFALRGDTRGSLVAPDGSPGAQAGSSDPLG